MIYLKEVTENNFESCISLNSGVEKSDFCDSVSHSLSEAWLYYNEMQPFAIYEDDKIIGFVLIYIGEQNYQIINFFIDQQFQNRGYGNQALKCCIDYLIEHFNIDKLSVPVHVDHILAQNFWKTQGFTFSDVIEDEYVFMRKYFI